MSFGPGEQLGPYQILKLIGKGGMGEVFQATDTRLHRSVAIKTSKREFNDRFEREARAIAAINHPNICTLYDVGPNYLVMEFVEGELLSKLLERGPLALDKALTYGIQIADALVAAHAKGIIHRDLKPANIIITSSGVKVLDFGLAKLAQERVPSEAAKTETLTAPLTKIGAILGTLYYMAPEQVEGKEAGDGADIFSLGVCLYEMLTAQHPFTGDTQAAVLAAILKDNPTPIVHRQPTTPRSLDRIIRRCLEKRAEDRWHSAREVKAALETIDLDAPPIASTSTGTPVSAPIIAPPPRAKWILPAALGAGLLVLTGLGFVAGSYSGKPAAPGKVTRFQVELPKHLALMEYMSVSPDGHKILFTGAGNGLWIRDLDTLAWRELTGTQEAAVYGPGWSPDGKFISYSNGAELKKIDPTGGPAITLCKSPGNTIGTSSWSADGSTIIFGSRGAGALFRVPSSGGTAEPLTLLDRGNGETANAVPSFLPDGKHFLYQRVGRKLGGVYVGSLDTKPEEQKNNRRILEIQKTTVYVNGKLVFVRDGTLMAQTFDMGKLELTGSPVPIAESVASVRNSAMFAVSPAGVLAYRKGADVGSVVSTAFYDRAGKVTSRLETPGSYFVLSPDGKLVVLEGRPSLVRDAVANGLWLFDIARGVRTRLTFQQDNTSNAVWSADGTRIYYTFENAIYEKAANGSGEAHRVVASTGDRILPTGVSSDGRFLLYAQNNGSSKFDIWVLPLKGSGKPVALLQTPDDEGDARFSPDGRWIAYRSNASNRNEIYIRPFIADGPEGPKLGEGQWQVSRNGGNTASWVKNGREIVFKSASTLYAVSVTAAGNAVELGAETQLFDNVVNFSWDVTRDGEKFLLTSMGTLVANTASADSIPITVVLNWEAELKQ